MDDKLRQIIGRYRNKVSSDTDTVFNVSLGGKTSLIKSNANPINSVVNLDEQFELERNESNIYRFLGRLNIITANELTKGTKDGVIRSTSDTDWDPLFTEFYDGNTITKTPNNWVIQVCYPSNMDDRYNLWGDNSNFKPVGLGIKVIGLTSNTTSNNRKLLVVETKQKHKLSVGDYIHLNRLTNTNQYQGIHKVLELGVDGKDTETKVTLETSWSGDILSELFLNRVVDSSDNDANYNDSQNLITLTLSDINGSVTNSDYTKIKVGKEHGLSVNSFIEIRNTNGGPLNGLHRVLNVIDDFNFVIRPTNTDTNVNGYTYRRMDGTPSEYYVRYFELLSSSEYDIYPGAFSSSIYPKTSLNEFGVANKTWLFNLTKDINTTYLINNRGGLVRELKFCFLKRSGKYPFDWSNVTSHWDFNSLEANTQNGLETVSVNNQTSSGTVVKNMVKTLTNEGSKYLGDMIEYNRRELNERVISEVIFRFGVETGVVNNNNIPENLDLVKGIETETTTGNLKDLEGYYYKPFKTINIRKLSNQIETAEPNELVDGIPNDYEQYPNGGYAWRDLLSHGFIEEGNNGVDWPFLNGRHYVYSNNFIYIRRQNPYNVVLDQSDIITAKTKYVC